MPRRTLFGDVDVGDVARQGRLAGVRGDAVAAAEVRGAVRAGRRRGRDARTACCSSARSADRDAERVDRRGDDAEPPAVEVSRVPVMFTANIGRPKTLAVSRAFWCIPLRRASP